MVLRFQVRRPKKLAGPLVHLQLSSPLIRRHGIQGVSSIPLVRPTYMPVVQWSQLPERAPHTSFEVCWGSPLISNFLWTTALDRLPYILHPCASYHNIFAADVLTVPDFLWPVSSLMQPSLRKNLHSLRFR